MINLQSILSLFDDKPTLLKWLKKVEAALAASVLTSVTISQPSETTAVLTFNFEDGTNIETPAITLPRGASVVNAMLDANNNLILVLDDGRQINVGNIMPANINAQNGTFSVSLTTPNANISVATIGNLSVTTHLEAESIDTAGTIYSEGGIIAEETIHTDENLEVGGNAAITGSVTAASFNGVNARPLYMHSIAVRQAAAGYYFNISIINQSDTPMSKTDLVSFMSNVLRFQISGSYKTAAFYFAPAYIYYYQSTHEIFLVGVDSTGAVHSQTINAINFTSILNDVGTLFDDNVIRLNG